MIVHNASVQHGGVLRCCRWSSSTWCGGAANQPISDQSSTTWHLNRAVSVAIFCCPCCILFGSEQSTGLSNVSHLPDEPCSRCSSSHRPYVPPPPPIPMHVLPAPTTDAMVIGSNCADLQYPTCLGLSKLDCRFVALKYFNLNLPPNWNKLVCRVQLDLIKTPCPCDATSSLASHFHRKHSPDPPKKSASVPLLTSQAEVA